MKIKIMVLHESLGDRGRTPPN